ncbi:MAG: FadR family transcriptional regulator [Acidimicrobiia bacterium]|nr:FadR family transcriptional regulator [Acidimicrobiia bacterium]
MKENSKPATPVPAYQQLANDLAMQIISGELKPGQRLPIETELGEKYSVSRSTVREALRVMSAQNLVTTQRGVSGGTFVVHPEWTHVSAYLESTIGLLEGTKALSLNHLLEVREILEVPAAKLAAERRQADHVDALYTSIGALDDVNAGHRFEGNRIFHVTILQASQNGLLSAVTEPVFDVLRIHILRDAAPPAFWESVAKDHKEIAEAIESGDADSAGRAMHSHLDQLRRGYLDLFQPPTAR